jgi:hypothetical protein
MDVSTAKATQWWDNNLPADREEEVGQAELRLASLGLAAS